MAQLNGHAPHHSAPDTQNDPLTFLDFFAGVGLVEISLESTWQCIWANDIDAKKKAIYDANFEPSCRYILDDVANIMVNDLPARADMAWASFPCQDLSLAGWRRGINGSRSGVFWSFHRLMSQLHLDGKKPKLIVIENVVGLLYGQNFVGLSEALNDLGMNFGALVMDAKQFVPQSRPRVFVVAIDRSIDTEDFESSGQEASVWITPGLRSAVTDLPEYLQERWKWWSVPAPEKPIASLDAVIEANPVDIPWHSEAQTAHLLNMMSKKNLAKIAEAQRRSEGSIGFLYRRTRNGMQRAEVRFDGIAGCLRTPNGGSSRQTVVIVEGESIRTRLLSSREAARLMGAPETFQLPGKYNDAYKAMGDGVAVPVVSWLSSQLLIPLATASRLTKIGSREAIAMMEDVIMTPPVSQLIGSHSK